MELENQFFGAFLAFWVAQILRSTDLKVPIVLTIIGAMAILVFLLRRSIYSSSPSRLNRGYFHAVAFGYSLVLIPVLHFIIPSYLESIEMNAFVLMAIVTGTVFFWILVTEFNRPNWAEVFQQTEEWYRHG